jgi:hypothetical protein
VELGENPTGALLVVGNNALAERLGASIAQQYPGEINNLLKTC